MFKCSCFKIQNQVIPVNNQIIAAQIKFDRDRIKAAQNKSFDEYLVNKQMNYQYKAIHNPPMSEIMFSNQPNDMSSISSQSQCSGIGDSFHSVNISLNSHKFANLDINIQLALNQAFLKQDDMRQVTTVSIS